MDDTPCQRFFLEPDQLHAPRRHQQLASALLRNGRVLFHYRDRAAGDIRQTACLPADEFLRRLLCHVLPSGFQRIRHYGLLASRTKQVRLARCRQVLGMPAPVPPPKKSTAQRVLALLGIDIER